MVESLKDEFGVLTAEVTTGGRGTRKKAMAGQLQQRSDKRHAAYVAAHKPTTLP